MLRKKAHRGNGAKPQWAISEADFFWPSSEASPSRWWILGIQPFPHQGIVSCTVTSDLETRRPEPWSLSLYLRRSSELSKSRDRENIPRIEVLSCTDTLASCCITRQTLKCHHHVRVSPQSPILHLTRNPQDSPLNPPPPRPPPQIPLLSPPHHPLQPRPPIPPPQPRPVRRQQHIPAPSRAPRPRRNR